MRSYDLIFVVKPDLDSQALGAAVERVTQRLMEQGARLEHTEVWGKRRMAYAIQRFREGQYVFIRFAVAGDRIPQIRHNLKITEDILRASITAAVGPVGSAKPAQPPSPAAVPAAEPVAHPEAPPA